MAAGKKLCYSRQRELIYRYLTATEEHPTAETIYIALRAESPDLRLGTIYRNLKLLVELGKIRKVAGHQGRERYDAILTDHVHFFCENCGRTRDLMDVDAEGIRGTISLEDGYQLSKLDLTISGPCPQCVQQVSNEKLSNQKRRSPLCL